MAWVLNCCSAASSCCLSSVSLSVSRFMPPAVDGMAMECLSSPVTLRITAIAPPTSSEHQQHGDPDDHGPRELFEAGGGGGGASSKVVVSLGGGGGVVPAPAVSPTLSERASPSLEVGPAPSTGWVGSSGSPGGEVGGPDGGFCALMRPSVPHGFVPSDRVPACEGGTLW